MTHDITAESLRGEHGITEDGHVTLTEEEWERILTKLDAQTADCKVLADATITLLVENEQMRTLLKLAKAALKAFVKRGDPSE